MKNQNGSGETGKEDPAAFFLTSIFENACLREHPHDDRRDGGMSTSTPQFTVRAILTEQSTDIIIALLITMLRMSYTVQDPETDDRRSVARG